MAYVRLEVWDVKYVPSGNVVDTGTLGPCVGVIIYDKEMKAAYAGHFVDANTDGLENMVKDALSIFEKPDHLDVYVAGNSVDDGLENRDYLLKNREFVPALLKRYGFLDSNTYIRWSPPSTDAYIVLNVDTAKNELWVLKRDGDPTCVVYRGDIRKAPNPIR